MTAKDYTRLFYFVQQTNSLKREQRWFMLSLMSYQARIGITDDVKKTEQFAVYSKKLEEWFDIPEIEMYSNMDILSRQYGFITISEFETESDVAFNVTINWSKIDAFRTEQINKQQAPSASTIDQFNKLIQSGVVVIEDGKIVMKDELHKNVVGKITQK